MKRGEVWLINLDPTIGAEIKKSRPAIIVNDDAIGILPLKVIVPVTEWKEHYAAAPWLVRLLPDGEMVWRNLQQPMRSRFARFPRKDSSGVWESFLMLR